MLKNLRLHLEADHENKRYPCTESLCEWTYRVPDPVPLHALRHHGRKDIIIFPRRYGMDVLELATGVALSLVEAQA
jgi:hypothetical protein